MAKSRSLFSQNRSIKMFDWVVNTLVYYHWESHGRIQEPIRHQLLNELQLLNKELKLTALHHYFHKSLHHGCLALTSLSRMKLNKHKIDIYKELALRRLGKTSNPSSLFQVSKDVVKYQSNLLKPSSYLGDSCVIFIKETKLTKPMTNFRQF